MRLISPSTVWVTARARVVRTLLVTGGQTRALGILDPVSTSPSLRSHQSERISMHLLARPGQGKAAKQETAAQRSAAWQVCTHVVA